MPSKIGLTLLVDLPTHLAEGVDAVGGFIEGEPVERALCQHAIHIFLFLHDCGLEFADAGKVEILGGVEDDRFLAILAVWMIGPFMYLLVARHDRVIKRVDPVRDNILAFQIPILHRREILAALPARRFLDLTCDGAATETGTRPPSER